MSSNVALLHSNNCCVLEPAICEDLDLLAVIFTSIHMECLNTASTANGDFLKLPKLAIMPILAPESLLRENKKKPVTKCYLSKNI